MTVPARRAATLVLALVAGFAAVGPVASAPAASAVAPGAQVPVCASGSAGGPEASAAGASAPAGGYAVGVCTLRLVDGSRHVRLPDGRSKPRTMLTYVRYPALGPSGAGELPGAPPARAGGPFPLLVFAHGFAITPAPYARLLDSWARAGYVVAAPVFPLASAGAPGGPDEGDVVNEPTDMSFVITRMLAASASGTSQLAGLLDPARVAVAGQSDGGEAALAVAYSRRYADPRVRAAIVLSGAEMSGLGGYRFGPGAPPLLAAQGTADTSNEPRYTYAYFRAARRPKYLLRLLGAQHLPPYTTEQPQLGVVERVTAAFLDAYLGRSDTALARLTGLGDVGGVAAMTAEP